MKNWNAIAAASGLDIPAADIDRIVKPLEALEDDLPAARRHADDRAMSPPLSSRRRGRRVTIREAAAALRSRAVSSVELTTSALERIERLDPKLNSFLTVTADAGARPGAPGR